MKTLKECLATVSDPRRAQGKRYDLVHALLYCVLAVASGATSYRKIHLFFDTHWRRLIEACRRYAGATVITPNRAELAQVVGHWNSEAELHERAHALRHELGIDGLLLTRSEEGMSLFEAHGDFHVSAQARDVFDVTGAGDTVIATLAVMLACGLSLRDAVPIANRAGGVVVGKFGTASVTYEELFS